MISNNIGGIGSNNSGIVLIRRICMIVFVDVFAISLVFVVFVSLLCVLVVFVVVFIVVFV